MTKSPAKNASAPAASVIGYDDDLARRYALVVADAIQHVLLPELRGNGAARAAECVTILSRLAERLAPIGPDLSETLAALQSAEPGPEDRKRIAELEGAVLDGSEDRARAALELLARTEGSGARTFDSTALERYLQAHESGGPSLRLTECNPVAGGRSKLTVLVSVEGARALPAHLVVRQDWLTSLTGTSVVTEFDLLKRIHEAGLRVPKPFLLERSPAVLGKPFLIVGRLPGAPRGDIFHPPKSEHLALQVAEQLGKLHRLPAEDFSAAGVPTEAFTPEQLRGGLEGFRAIDAKLGLGSRTIDVAFDWLGERLERVDGGKAMLHNDLGCHNFLIDGEELTAILDWELAHVGNPAADLGYVRDWVGQMTPWSRFMDAYRAAGGPEISEATLDFYTIWVGIRLYCLLLQARAGLAMGAINDTEITYACAELLPVLLHRISRQLRAVLQTNG